MKETSEYGSGFTQNNGYQVYQPPTFEDMDDNLYTVLQTIQQYRQYKNYTMANKLLEEYDEEIKHKIINADIVNRMIEEVRNAQIAIKRNKQQIYTVTALNEIPSSIMSTDIYLMQTKTTNITL